MAKSETKKNKKPKGLRIDLINKLKKINPNINLAVEQLLRTKKAELENSSTEESRIQANKPNLCVNYEELDYEVLAKRVWPHLKAKVDIMIDLAIQDAKRGY